MSGLDISDVPDRPVRPRVITEPWVCFGRPHIRSRAVDVLAEQVMAGDSVGFVAEQAELSRAEVIVACWFQARYGPGPYRKRWGPWLAEVEQELWRSRFDVPDPPAKEE